MSQKGKKKILITGASGMLGTDLCPVLKEEYSIIKTDVRSQKSDVRNLDVTSPDVFRKIEKESPDLTIHLASYTDVDECESNYNKAYLVNGLGTRNVALACQKLDIPLLYISTDYVFDGDKKEPYFEFDKPNPLSVYGKSKYMGEEYVKILLRKFYIVRISWLYGKNGKNFVDTIIKLAKESSAGLYAPLKVVDDQIGSPTYTKDIAEAIKVLISTDYFGVYHITNSGYCSWYEFAKVILTLSDSEGEESKSEERCKVIPVTTEEFPRPAKRPHNSRLENFVYNETFRKPLRSWKEAVKDYLEL